MGSIEIFSYSLNFNFLIIILCFASSQISADDETETSSYYGTDWVLFPDDSGSLHFANLSFVPSIVDRLYRNVYFHLYTQRNPQEYEELFIDSDTESEYFEPDNPIKFITHGWMSNGNSSTVISIKDAYIENRDINAIIVDWHEISKEPIYVVAATSTRYVGYKVSQMAGNLVERFNVTGDQIHMIGHSLGAHVMGYAGKYLQKDNITAARITGESILTIRGGGLDPAKPLFEFPPIGGLSTEDAEFVDIIHTCGGLLGYKRSHGHADFYPNDGTPPQPGCDGLAQLIEACSHGRSYRYFAESINSDGFVAYPCDSYDTYQAGDCRNGSTLMGDMADPSARGDYYLRTNAEPEYARGDDIDEEEK